MPQRFGDPDARVAAPVLPGPRAEVGSEQQDRFVVRRKPVRVLFIAGSGRSGSTLIERILGQLDGFFSAGEMRYLWQRGLLDDRLCGCGVPFGACPTWRAILDLALPARSELDVERIAAHQRQRVRMRHVPGLLAGALRRRPVRPSPGDAPLSAVYRGIVEQTGAAVVVDSSKLPPYGQLVRGLPDVELFVLHVVRDPRATAFSWTRTRVLRDFGDERLMQQQRPLKSTGLWLLWNTTAELLWRRRGGRYLRVRYEDFVRAPQLTIERIAAFAGASPSSTPFRSVSEVELAPTHSVAGNPSRHRSGPVALRADSEWTHAMRRRDTALVTALTWPWLLRYRYALSPGRR